MSKADDERMATRDEMWKIIAQNIACESDCQKWPNGCGCAQAAADALLARSPAQCDSAKRRASKRLFGDAAWLDRPEMADQMDDPFNDDNGSRCRMITPNELIAELEAADCLSPAALDSPIEAALRDAFPHFQDGAEVTPEAIKKLGSEWFEMVMGWAPVPKEIKFQDANGNDHVLKDDEGWYLDAAVIDDHELTQLRAQVDDLRSKLERANSQRDSYIVTDDRNSDEHTSTVGEGK